jgi:hypothetical protein
MGHTSGMKNEHHILLMEKPQSNGFQVEISK